MANNITGIRRRGKSYQVIVTRRDGTQYTRTAPNVTEAKALRAKMLTEVADGLNVASKHTLRSYYEIVWLPSITKSLRKPTVATYRTAMERHWLPMLGSTKLGDLTAPKVKRGQEKIGETLARSTVVTTMNALKSLLTHACSEGHLTVNVARLVKAPPMPHNRDKDLRMLSEEAVSLFLSVVEPHYHLFFKTLAETGLRISEIVALRWCDVEQDRIHVKQRFAYAEMNSPKTGKRRFVPITPELHEALTIWHKTTRWSEPEHLVFQYAGFKGSGTRPMDDSYLSKTVLHPAMDKAGIERMGFHSFRHGAATTWFERGASVEDVAALLGNTVAVCLQTYIHLIPDTLISRASKFLGQPMPVREQVTV